MKVFKVKKKKNVLTIFFFHFLPLRTIGVVVIPEV